MDVRIIAFAYAVLPISVGGAIYIICRPETLLVFSWAETAGLSSVIQLARDQLGGLCDPTPSWIIFNLPNGIWAFSLFSVIKAIWGTKELEARLWLLLAFMLTFGLEIGQAAALVPGTFDRRDLYAMLLGTVFAFLIVESPTIQSANSLKDWSH